MQLFQEGAKTGSAENIYLEKNQKCWARRIVFVNAWVCGRIRGWRQERKAGWQSRPRCNLESLRAKSLELWPTLCCPLDCSLPGSCIHAIFMARILEWVAISPSRGPSQSRDWNRDSCVSCIAGRFFTSEPPGKPKVVGPWITHMYKWSLCI